MARDDALVSVDNSVGAGSIYTGSGRICSVVLTPAAALATYVLRDGGAGGTVLLRLQAAASGNSAVWNNSSGIGFGTDLHVTIAGAGATAQTMYDT